MIWARYNRNQICLWLRISWKCGVRTLYGLKIIPNRLKPINPMWWRRTQTHPDTALWSFPTNIPRPSSDPAQSPSRTGTMWWPQEAPPSMSSCPVTQEVGCSPVDMLWPVRCAREWDVPPQTEHLRPSLAPPPSISYSTRQFPMVGALLSWPHEDRVHMWQLLETYFPNRSR